MKRPKKGRGGNGLWERKREREREKEEKEGKKRIRIGHSTGWLTSELQSYLSKKAGQSANADTRQAA